MPTEMSTNILEWYEGIGKNWFRLGPLQVSAEAHARPHTLPPKHEETSEK
jgi:hypothetical protein